MALHGYVNTMHTMSWDVDACNMAGVYATTDLDNGVMVTLSKVNQDAKNVIKGFEYQVVPAQEASTQVWVVASPEVGSTLEQQLLADPRQFYNAKGKAMSIKALVPGIDVIEVTKECFVGGTMPTTTNNKVKIGANGKLVAGATVPDAGAYFTFEGFHTVTIGMEEVQTAVLRCARN